MHPLLIVNLYASIFISHNDIAFVASIKIGKEGWNSKVRIQIFCLSSHID